MLLGGPVHVTGNPGLARQKENALARSQKVKEENSYLQNLNHRLTQVHPERKLQQHQQKSDVRARRVLSNM